MLKALSDRYPIAAAMAARESSVRRAARASRMSQLAWLDEVSAIRLGYPHGMWSVFERAEKNRSGQP